MISRCLIRISVLFCVSLFWLSGCYTSHKQEDKPAYIQHVDSMPNDFGNYALASAGSLHVDGELITDGPLSDVYSTGHIKGSGKISAMGRLISGRSIQLPASSLRGLTSEVPLENISSAGLHALSVDDAIAQDSFLNGYQLASSGEVFLIEGGVFKPALPTDLAGTWQFTPNVGWTVTGDYVLLDKPLRVETDLSIQTSNFTLLNALYVHGNVLASGDVTVHAVDPFVNALVTDGQLETENLDVVGRLSVGDDLTTHQQMSIVGSLKVMGNTTFQGTTKITYLDTLYKAALFSAQQIWPETLLVHSQVFKNLEGGNAVALFTFVKGYVQYAAKACW